MKIFTTKIAIFTVFTTLFFGSCDEEYLTPNRENLVFENQYYTNEAEAFSGLVSAYDVLGKHSGGFENIITMMNAGSDDHFAGGGSSADGAGIQAFSDYTLNANNVPASFWNSYFQGIFRANTILKKLPNVPMDDAKKARFTAEAKALRAYFYFELVRLFKNVPLFSQPVLPENIGTITQSSSTAVYAQIESDLIAAMEVLPNTIPNPSPELGRFTKGGAQALLGKVYLYQGKKAQAATQFEAVNGTPGGTSQYGYKLLASFSGLWNPNNKFNTESVIEIAHTSKSNATYGNWGNGDAEGNIVNQMVGPRGYLKINSSAPSYAGGWSFNVITEDLFQFIKLDPRFNATVANLKLLKQQGQIDYAAGYKDTGYFLKKFMPQTADITSGGGESALNFRQNTYAIRLADTYLMEAEALDATGIRAQALLDAVRARVGLPSIPVSATAIQNERRLELAGEGHRWFDLVRTGQAATVLASRGFVAGRNEIFPIPFKELENTLIVQNPNYN